MIRLLDARTGLPAEVRPARRGLLRMCADPPAGGSPLDITWLRVLLVADLLTRTAEMRDMQASTVLTTAVDDPGHLIDALGIHPPAGQASGPADIFITTQASHDGRDGLTVLVGAAQTSQPPNEDPLAIRLALLAVPFGEPADLTEAALATAAGSLARWRAAVARWAESPSKPIPADLAQRLRQAIDDLDTGSMLAFLDDLAAGDQVPNGARFESFAYTDRVLGLDLVRDIGKT